MNRKAFTANVVCLPKKALLCFCCVMLTRQPDRMLGTVKVARPIPWSATRPWTEIFALRLSKV